MSSWDKQALLAVSPLATQPEVLLDTPAWQTFAQRHRLLWEPAQLVKEDGVKDKVRVLVPESVRDHFHNRVIQSVVSHMLEQKENELPANMDWGDVRSYHEAWLAARKVKVDYALFLMELWEAVWRPPLERWGVQGHHACAMPEMVAEDAEPSLKRCWEEGFHRWFWLEHLQCNLYTQVTVYEDASVVIFFGADNAQGFDVLADIPLSKGWTAEPDENGNRVVTGSLPKIKKGAHEVDVTALLKRADEIVSATLEAADV